MHLYFVLAPEMGDSNSVIYATQLRNCVPALLISKAKPNLECSKRES